MLLSGQPQVLHIPGCLPTTIQINECLGYCESYPSDGLTRRNNLDKSQCCNIADTHDVSNHFKRFIKYLFLKKIFHGQVLACDFKTTYILSCNKPIQSRTQTILYIFWLQIRIMVYCFGHGWQWITIKSAAQCECSDCR